MRCGNKYVTGAPAFRSNILALCDPNSTAPRLTRKLHGEKNCSSNICTDFRDTVTAELNEFVPSSGRESNNFTRDGVL